MFVVEGKLRNRSLAFTALFLSSLVYCGHGAFAQCSLNIQSDIRSGWEKANVSYAVEKNTLNIKVDEARRDDADSIYIGSIKGCTTLTIEAANISGKYPWDGKVIGFSFFNERLEPGQWGNQASFPTPRGHAIDDGFLKAWPSNNDKLIYDITNSGGTTHIGAKVFIGSHNAIKIQFSAQDASIKRQPTARLPARSPKRYAGGASYRSNAAANSCALSCHEPRTEHAEFEYTDDFSVPSSAYCPHESD